MIETKMFPKFDAAFKKLVEPNRRHTIVLTADVKHGVFNGDPDNPPKNRADAYTGHGLATDTCGKAIIRANANFLAAEGYPMPKAAGADSYAFDNAYMAVRGVLNENNQEVYRAVGVQGYAAKDRGIPAKIAAGISERLDELTLPAGYTIVGEGDKLALRFDGTGDAEDRMAAEAAFKAIDPGFVKLIKELHKDAKTKTLDDKTLVKLNQELCRRYFDVRWFGAVASTGDSCGNVKGPFQFSHGVSIDPLEEAEECITRSSITRVEDKERKRQDMGRKTPILYGLFRYEITFSPNLARRIGTKGITSEDLAFFYTALYNFGRFSGSSMRGHIEPAGIYVFVHDHPLGNAHDHELYSRIKVARKASVAHARQLSDYEIAVNDSDMPEGVELIRFYERKLS